MKIFKKKMIYITMVNIFTINFILASSSFALNYVEDAKQYMKKGEYQSAIIQLKNQLKENPEDIQARFLLGKSHLERWEVKQAEKEIIRAYHLDPSSQKIALVYAKLLLLRKQYNKMNEILDKRFSDPNDENQRLLYKAYAFMGQNKLADAKRILTELNNHYENEEVFNGFAKIALLENKMTIAEQWVDKSLKIKPENFDGLQIKARVANGMNKLPEALLIYDSLIKKRKNNLKLYLQRAAIKFQLGDEQGAEEDVQVVLAKINNQPHANYMLARIKLKEKKYKKSQIAAQEVLNIMPQNFEAMLVLGIANFYQSNYYQAEKYLTQYLSANPNSLVGQNILANIYLEQGKGEQALLILETIDEGKRNNNANTLTIMGSAYLLTGEHQKGINALNKAKNLEPDSVVIQKRIITEQFRSGDIDNAIISLEKAADLKHSDQKMKHLLIISYIQKNELDKAEAKLNDLLTRTPRDPVLYNLLATIAKIQKNTKKAKKLYRQAIDIDSQFIPAYFGLAEQAIEEKNWALAKDYYSKVMIINPGYVKTYTKLAAIAIKQNDHQEIEKQLKFGFEKAGDSTSQIYLANLLSQWYLKQKKPEKIMSLAKILNRQHPNDNAVLSFLAAAQIANQKNGQAEQTLRTLIHKINQDVKHRILLATLLVRAKGAGSEILSLLDDAIRISPDDIKPVSLKLSYLIKDKQYKQAILTAEYAIKQFPKRAFGYKFLADVYRIVNTLDKALVNYQIAYELRPDIKQLFVISDLLISQGEKKFAIDFLENELKNSDNKLIIHFKIGNIYQKDNQYEMAAQHYLKMLEIKDSSVLALNNLAWVYQQENNPKALVFAKKAYELSPESVEVMDTYGYLQIKYGDRAKGIYLLEQVVTLLANDSDVKYHLAEGYSESGEKNKAKELLYSILNDGNNFYEKKNAQELINKL